MKGPAPSDWAAASFPLYGHPQELTDPEGVIIVDDFDFDVAAEETDHLGLVEDIEFEGAVAGHFGFADLLGL